MSLRSPLRKELLHIAAELARLIQRPSELGDLRMKVMTRSYSTPIAEAARSALRNDRLIKPLVDKHYWGVWPDMGTLSSLPDGTLGKEFIRTLAQFEFQGLPNPIIREGIASDDQWLHLRLRHTHDIWHVVTGLPSTPAGETALHAFMVMQLRWPGSLLLLGAYLMERCLKGPVAGEVDMGIAVAFGLQLGYVCAPLAAQRWEEGWDRPLSDWREQLGITELLKLSPFSGQSSELN